MYVSDSQALSGYRSQDLLLSYWATGRGEIGVFTCISLLSIIHCRLYELGPANSLILLASRQESLHWLPFSVPRKWLMHLMYIITNVLFALQLNCDCYVQSIGKGHGIAPASSLMEKSMRIHFNHCGCGRMSTTLRDCQWPGNYRCLYRFRLWQFRYPQIFLFHALQLCWKPCGVKWSAGRCGPWPL